MGYETAFFMLLLPSLRSEYRSPSFALPSLLIGFQNFEASVKMLVWVFYPLGLDNQEFDQPLKENRKNAPIILSILNMRQTQEFHSSFGCQTTNVNICSFGHLEIWTKNKFFLLLSNKVTTIFLFSCPFLQKNIRERDPSLC